VDLRTTRASTQILPGFGVTEITPDPNGADIFQDGKFVGTSPATLRIAEGTHTLLLKSAHHTDWSRSISILKVSTRHRKSYDRPDLDSDLAARFIYIRCRVVASMTPDEARHLIIEGMNYAAYRETGSSLHDADKNRLFGADHYKSDRMIVKPSPWAEGDFEEKMSTLLRWANILNRSVPAFQEAQTLLEDENSVLGQVIRRTKQPD
jgi:hypothetical protein